MPAPARSPATLTASHLSVRRGGSPILLDVSLTIGPGTCLGVVGPNGAGKTTLLRVLAGLERPDGGSRHVDPPHATVGYLAQEPDVHPHETLRRTLRRRSGVADAEDRLQRAADDLARGDPAAAERYALALERFDALSAATFEPRLQEVLAAVGLPEAAAERSTAGMSGGEATRVELAAIMLSRFDVTLLDEPTNNLDFAGLELLEAFVNQHRRRNALVVVSHDRAFLHRTVTSVLEVDAHSHTARVFGGGWASFLEERSTLARHAHGAYADYRAQRQTLLDRAQRERQWATSAVRREKRAPRDTDKAQRDFRINRTEKLASRARRTERALNRLPVVEKPWEDWQLRFVIEEAPRAGAVVVRLDRAVVRRGDFELGPIDVEIVWGERVGLVGANGSGKTSLVQAITGRLPLAGGERWIGPGVVTGELGQDRRALSGHDSVLEAVVRRCELRVPEARSLLAKFGLDAEHAERPGAALSPGERTRAELACFQARGVNFLVLDEPSNHLDMPSIEQLEQALRTFGGTLLLVSHDRDLLDAVTLTRRIALAPR